MEIFNKIRNKIAVQHSMFVYHIKNVLLNGVASSIFTPPVLQRFIYKALGYKIHRSSRICPLCFCGVGNGKRGRLTIGRNSFINYRCFLDLGDDIVIGDNVAIAFGCTFVNSSHVLGEKECRAGKSIADKIIVEDGCWIGANSTIMPGVRISKGCVIGSNSLILQDTEPNCLYVGQPARKVKELFI